MPLVRLGRDTSTADEWGAVERVLADFDLIEHASTAVRSLSDGLALGLLAPALVTNASQATSALPMLLRRGQGPTAGLASRANG